LSDHHLCAYRDDRSFYTVTTIDNAVIGGRSQLSLFLLHDHLLVTLGAHVHCGSAAKEATVVDAKDWALRLLAASLLVFHDECKLCIKQTIERSVEINYCNIGRTQ
jgi:hypothetical protein